MTTNNNLKFIVITFLMILTVSGCKQTPSELVGNLSTPYPTSTPYPILSTPVPQASLTPELDALFIYNRAVYSLRMEEYADAINGFSQVIKRIPNLSIGYKGRGGAYYYSEKIDFAVEDLEHAVLIDPNLGGAYLYLGMIYRDQGDLSKAEEYMTRALELIHPVRERWEMDVAVKALKNLNTK